MLMALAAAPGVDAWATMPLAATAPATRAGAHSPLSLLHTEDPQRERVRCVCKRRAAWNPSLRAATPRGRLQNLTISLPLPPLLAPERLSGAMRGFHGEKLVETRPPMQRAAFLSGSAQQRPKTLSAVTNLQASNDRISSFRRAGGMGSAVPLNGSRVLTVLM